MTSLRLRRFILVPVALVLLAGLAPPTAVWAAADTGTVTGTVRAAGSSTPLAGIGVSFYNAAGSYVTSATTDANGGYSRAAIAVGTYYVRTTAGSLGYFDQIYNGVACGTSCPNVTTGTAVVVSAGGTSAGVDFNLTAAGRISGTVTAAVGGATLSGVRIYVYNSSGSNIGSSTTNASGAFTTSVPLTTGNYYLRTSNTAGYVDQAYGGLVCPGGGCTITSSTPVAVTQGATTPGANFALAAGGFVSGTVTDAASKLAVASNFEVDIYSSTGQSLTYAYTDAAGLYTTTTGLPAGTYYVRTYSYTTGQRGYLNQIYSGVNCGLSCPAVTTGTSVTVAAGATTTGVDFALVAASIISGTVTAAGSGATLSGVSVTAYTSTGAYLTSTSTNASGAYSIGSLVAGTYYLKASNSPGFITQLYSGIACPLGSACTPTSGTAVTVAQSATFTANFALAAAGIISGTVTAAGSGGAPLSGVSVTAYTSTGAYLTSASTNASGAYTIGSLVAGTYYLKTSNSAGFIDQLYDAITCPLGSQCTPTSGTAITVAQGATSTANFALAAGGRITGTITSAATSAPISGVSVSVYNSSGNYLAAVSTNASGVYTLSGLTAGNYYLSTYAPSPYLNQIYNGIGCGAYCPPPTTSGTPVAVTTGGTTSGINFALPTSGTISGTVTNASGGAPVPGITVSAYDGTGSQRGSGTTDANGSYSISSALTTGSYYLTTSNSSGYFNQAYNGIACSLSRSYCDPASGTPVAVTQGATTSGINFALRAGGRISGTIRSSAGGAPIANVWVEFYTSDGTQVDPVLTNAAGVYITGAGLASGTYYLRTHSTGFIDQLYSGLVCTEFGCPPLASGTGVAVVEGATVSGIDFSLAPGGAISGTVRAAGTGSPLAGVRVSIYISDSYWRDAGTTDGNGAYTTTLALPTGTFFIRTSNTLGYVDRLYPAVDCPGGSCAADAGTGVSVTASATTPGIDFSLTLGGSITGTVKAASGGAPLLGASVTVSTSSGTVVATATTNASGVYTAGGLLGGSYYLSVSPPYSGGNYLAQVYSGLNCGTTCPPTATGTSVAVTLGAATPGIDFSLARGGTVAGTVTDAGGLPVQASVDVLDERGRAVAYGYTDQGGKYQTSPGLPAGSYYLTAHDSAHVQQFYGGFDCSVNCAATDGTPVAVALEATTSGIDFSLHAGGEIRGKVSDAATGAAFSYPEVEVYSLGGTYVDSGGSSSPDGTYVARGLLPGSYYVMVWADRPYASQLYGGVPLGPAYDVRAGTAVKTTASAPTPGIDLMLLPNAGSIAGRVIEAGTGKPLSGAEIQIHSGPDGNVAAGEDTDANGEYRTVGLPPGSYYVTVRSAGHVPQIYPGITCLLNCSDAAGTPVTVAAGETRAGVDFVLPVAGGFTGTVTDGGLLANDALVDVFDSSGSHVLRVDTWNGKYEMAGFLPAGTYYARTGSHRIQRYSGQACLGGACSPLDGTPIAVTAGSETAGIDFSLAACAPMRLMPPGVLPAATPATSYSHTLQVSGGTGPYTFSIEPWIYLGDTIWRSNLLSRLPSGITLNGASGEIAGQTSVPGESDFTVRVVDAVGCSTSRRYTLPVRGANWGTPPSVSSVSPTTGPVTGGTPVVVTGTGFADGARVTFGGVPASGVTVTSGSAINAVAPAHGAGTVSIVVTNADTQGGALASAFTYVGVPAPTFTDDPLQPGITVVKAVHLTELRQAITTLRARFGFLAVNWTDPGAAAGVTVIKATHFQQLRAALDTVYSAAGRPTPVYSTSTLTPRATAITAAQVAELRAAIVAIW